VRQREIVQCAWNCGESGGFTSLPINPKVVASTAQIGVMPWKPTKLGVSGFLMRSGNQFGIGYSTAIANEGFENFTIAHELGHYFLDGHPEAIFAGGNDRHYSRSGFVSDDVYEKEADTFAAELLMPEKFFKAAIQKSGTGFAAIQNLANLGRTSLVATAIRYATTTGDPVAVILSSGNEVQWSFVSKELQQCRGVYTLGKKSILPPNSGTAKFNRDTAKIANAEKFETVCSLRDWFERAPDVEFQEDVVGLGHYGKTLTVLFTEESLRDEDEDDEEEDDGESGMPSSRWHRRDQTRRFD
jgi:Zn-dependent peptidase ImmA (M78 family)